MRSWSCAGRAGLLFLRPAVGRCWSLTFSRSRPLVPVAQSSSTQVPTILSDCPRVRYVVLWQNDADLSELLRPAQHDASQVHFVRHPLRARALCRAVMRAARAMPSSKTQRRLSGAAAAAAAATPSGVPLLLLETPSPTAGRVVTSPRTWPGSASRPSRVEEETAAGGDDSGSGGDDCGGRDGAPTTVTCGAISAAQRLPEASSAKVLHGPATDLPRPIVISAATEALRLPGAAAPAAAAEPPSSLRVMVVDDIGMNRKVPTTPPVLTPALTADCRFDCFHVVSVYLLCLLRLSIE